MIQTILSGKKINTLIAGEKRYFFTGCNYKVPARINAPSRKMNHRAKSIKANRINSIHVYLFRCSSETCFNCDLIQSRNIRTYHSDYYFFKPVAPPDINLALGLLRRSSWSSSFLIILSIS